MNAPQTQLIWNKGGWIGSVIGCTTWMVLSGFAVIGRDPLLGSIALALVLSVLVLARALWQRRADVHPIRGLQLLCAASFIAALLGVGFAIWRGTIPSKLTTPLLLSLVVYPLMAGVFELRKRAEDRAATH
jgi:uncharacterized membrane protein YfcA